MIWDDFLRFNGLRSSKLFLIDGYAWTAFVAFFKSSKSVYGFGVNYPDDSFVWKTAELL